VAAEQCLDDKPCQDSACGPRPDQLLVSTPHLAVAVLACLWQWENGHCTRLQAVGEWLFIAKAKKLGEVSSRHATSEPTNSTLTHSHVPLRLLFPGTSESATTGRTLREFSACCPLFDCSSCRSHTHTLSLDTHTHTQTHTQTNTHTCTTHTHTHARARARTHARAHTHTHTHTHKHTHTHTHTHTRTRTRAHAHTHTRTRTRARTHIHTHTHTRCSLATGCLRIDSHALKHTVPCSRAEGKAPFLTSQSLHVRGSSRYFTSLPCTPECSSPHRLPTPTQLTLLNCSCSLAEITPHPPTHPPIHPCT
jgi:hypothetical protein